MEIKKQVSFDHQISEDGQVNVRKITRLMEGEVELSKTYHRHVITVADDDSKEDARTKKILKMLKE